MMRFSSCNCNENCFQQFGFYRSSVWTEPADIHLHSKAHSFAGCLSDHWWISMSFSTSLSVCSILFPLITAHNLMSELVCFGFFYIWITSIVTKTWLKSHIYYDKIVMCSMQLYSKASLFNSFPFNVHSLNY